MGFTFGFTEDIDSDLESTILLEKKEASFENPIDSIKIHRLPLVHTCKELTDKLIGNRITYEGVKVLQDTILYKRELFDVKHQLMMEDNDVGKTCEDDEEFKILIGETDEDLKNGIYEGGLKSWECSFDLISKLNSMNSVKELLSYGFNLLELGCGTSLPSLYILKKVFESRKNNKYNGGKVKVILSDYNYDVLRLVTLPNVLITWCSTVPTSDELIELQKREGQDGNIREGEIDVTIKLAEAFKNWLETNRIDIYLISGSWCREFMNMINEIMPDISNDKNLILTSETIYSPAILPVISEMVLELTRPEKSVGLLSAKDIYFGVGGSINDFLEYVDNRNGYTVDVEKVDSNLKRSVVCIRHI